jgi:hypothetical protein
MSWLGLLLVIINFLCIKGGKGGKGGQCVGLMTLPPSCDDCLEIWETKTPRTIKACPDL